MNYQKVRVGGHRQQPEEYRSVKRREQRDLWHLCTACRTGKMKKWLKEFINYLVDKKDVHNFAISKLKQPVGMYHSTADISMMRCFSVWYTWNYDVTRSDHLTLTDFDLDTDFPASRPAAPPCFTRAARRYWSSHPSVCTTSSVRPGSCCNHCTRLRNCLVLPRLTSGRAGCGRADVKTGPPLDGPV